MRYTVLPWLLWALLVGGVVAMVLHAGQVRAAAKFYAEADGARVVLHDDKCQLPEVSNLPFRAEWTEKGTTYEGCWSPPHPNVGVVMAYFTDKTVVGLPAQMFKALTQS